MRVQTKIIFLLLAIVAVFASSILLQRVFEKQRLITLFSNEEEQIQQVFEKILELKGKSLNTLAYDYTYWDEMVNFVANRDKNWAAENIDTALSSYGANVIWVYKADGTLVYSVDNLENSGLRDIPFTRNMLNSLFAGQPFC
nr:hypothetical protein [Candidatus Omnitrophota bacterium]